VVLNITPYSCQPILINIWYVRIINIYASLELEYPNFIQLVHIWINNNKKKRVQTLFVSDPLLLSYYLCMKNYIPRYITRKYINKLSFAHVQKYLFAYSSNFFFTVGLTCAIIWLHKFGVSSNFLRNRVTSFLERRASSRTGGRSFELPSFCAAHLSLFHTSMIGKKNPSHTWLASYCGRFGHFKKKQDTN